MKHIKFIILIMALLLSHTLVAQEHFKFMGISMGLNEKAFVNELQKKGFKYGKNSEGNPYLTGEFRDMPARIVYNVSPVSKKPWIVSIAFNISDWYNGKHYYNTLKNDLCSKYGEPELVQEDIPAEYTGRELEYVSGNSHNVQTIWQLSNGAVVLAITSFELYGVYQGSINIQYVDSANRRLEAEERVSDL